MKKLKLKKEKKERKQTGERVSRTRKFVPITQEIDE